MRRIGRVMCGGIAILLFLSVFSVLGCHGGRQEWSTEETSANSGTLDPSNTGTAGTENATDTGTLPPNSEQPPSGTADATVVISKVYGNGGSMDAAARYSFIELYNIGEKAQSMAGLSLYYRTDDEKEYQTYQFASNITVAPKSALLIRCKEAGKNGQEYDSTYEVISVDAYDLTWDIRLDNKVIYLALAPNDLHPDKTTKPAAFTDAISIFTAESEETQTGTDVFTVKDLSKNKVAVRTALTAYSGYHLVNLTKSNSTTLRNTLPCTASGEKNRIVASRLNEVCFSADAGFYAESFDLSLSAADGYTVYYTTDGSDPSVSSTRVKYTRPIRLTDTSAVEMGSLSKQVVKYLGSAYSYDKLPGAHVIKAYATNGSDCTGIYTNTYFVSAHMEEYGVTVMSLSMDKSVFCGQSGFYNNYYSSANGTNTRGVGLMEVFDTNGVRQGYSNIELAISGHGSSGFAMKSMRLYYKGTNNRVYDAQKGEENGKTEAAYAVKVESGFSSDLNYDLFGGYARNQEGQAITTFSRLLLRNSGNDCGNSYIRDAYMQRVCASLETDSMAYAPVLLFINGEFWGVYNARERYSPEYAEAHYGVEKDDVAVIESDYSQVHTNQNADFVISAGVEGDQDDFNDLTAFVRSHDLSIQANYDYVASRIDIDSFLDMYVARIYFCARDWPENNIKIWRTRTDDDPSGVEQKWRFSLLDMDMGISFYPYENNTSETGNYFYFCNATNCVIGTYMDRLLKNTAFRDRFLARFYEVVTEVLTPTYLKSELDGMVKERAPLMQLQYKRWKTDGASASRYNATLTDMYEFIEGRSQIVLNQMYAYFGVSEAYVLSLLGGRIAINCNDDRVNVTVNGKTVKNGDILKLENSEESFDVVVTVRDGYRLGTLSFTDALGKTVDGTDGRLQFVASASGTVTVSANRIFTGEKLPISAGITAGGYSMYCLTEEGRLYSWGYNGGNVLGYTGATISGTPTLVMEDVAKIAVSHANDCENGNMKSALAVLTVYGEVYTIGENGSGQLGRSGNSGILLPIDFEGRVTDISMGLDHFLLIDDAGTLWGVGNNSYGQLGKNGLGSSVSSFRKIATGIISAAAGRRDTFYVLENGDCYVMGDGRWKKYTGQEEKITTPKKLLSNVAYVAAGEHQALFVTADGKLYYSGWRNLSTFANGTGTGGPTYLTNGVKKATIHYDSMLILKTDGSVYGYGLNSGNAIGAQATGKNIKPLVASGVKDIASGYLFSAFLMQDGTVRTQGDCSYGQSGNGKTNTTVGMTGIVIH